MTSYDSCDNCGCTIIICNQTWRDEKDDLCPSCKEKRKSMQMYIGTKIIHARPMTLGHYNTHRGWEIPKDKDPMKDGFLVEYGDGYQSWSPAEAFKSYRPTNGMNFGLAIEAVKMGHKVERAGWNGKGINIFLVDEATGFKRVGHDGENCDVRLQEHIVIDTTGLQTNNPDAPKSIIPWLASQTDMLADDWVII